VERMEEIRLEALRALTILAVHDEEFRREMWDDPEGTLDRYGFALNDPEMAQVNNFFYAVLGEGYVLSMAGVTSLDSTSYSRWLRSGRGNAPSRRGHRVCKSARGGSWSHATSRSAASTSSLLSAWRSSRHPPLTTCVPS
jgi:hypothetical protein